MSETTAPRMECGFCLEVITGPYIMLTDEETGDTWACCQPCAAKELERIDPPVN